MALGGAYGLSIAKQRLPLKNQLHVAEEEMKCYAVLCTTKSRPPNMSLDQYLADGM